MEYHLNDNEYIAFYIGDVNYACFSANHIEVLENGTVRLTLDGVETGFIREYDQLEVAVMDVTVTRGSVLNGYKLCVDPGTYEPQYGASENSSFTVLNNGALVLYNVILSQTDPIVIFPNWKFILATLGE